MEIKIMNQDSWTKMYSIVKPIIRVGRGAMADIQIKDAQMPDLLMQFFIVSGDDLKITMRAFDDVVSITRGVHEFTCSQAEPYEIFVGDVIRFFGYQLIMQPSFSQLQVQESKHMSAALKLSDPILYTKGPILGELTLKNLGTDRPCQFNLTTEGIPSACLEVEPLPFLHPGSVSTVSFLIKHLTTIPAPGPTHLSFILSAPKEYLGETIIFRKSIYVESAIQSDFCLFDDLNPISPEDIQTRPAPVKAAPELKQISNDMNPSQKEGPAIKTEAEIQNANKSQKNQKLSEKAEVKPDTTAADPEEKTIRVISGRKTAFEDEKGSFTPEVTIPETAGETKPEIKTQSGKEQEAKPVQDLKSMKIIKAGQEELPEEAPFEAQAAAEETVPAQEPKAIKIIKAGQEELPEEASDEAQSAAEETAPAPEPEEVKIIKAGQEELPEEAPFEAQAAAEETVPAQEPEAIKAMEAGQEELSEEVSDEAQTTAEEAAPAPEAESAKTMKTGQEELSEEVSDEAQEAAEKTTEPETDNLLTETPDAATKTAEKPRTAPVYPAGQASARSEGNHILVFHKTDAAFFDDEEDTEPESPESTGDQKPKVITVKGSADAFD